MSWFSPQVNHTVHTVPLPLQPLTQERRADWSCSKSEVLGYPTRVAKLRCSSHLLGLFTFCYSQATPRLDHVLHLYTLAKKGGAMKLCAGCASLERFGGTFCRLLWVLLRLKNLRSPQKKNVSLSWVLAQRSKTRASEKSQERWFWLHRPWLIRPPAVFLFPVPKTVSSIMCLKTIVCMIFSFHFFHLHFYDYILMAWKFRKRGKPQICSAT